MPKREIGVMGYIGELVVENWLKKKYPEDKIISQIAVEKKRGGGHLDFGILSKEKKIKAIYEVKTQDYIAGRDFKLNQGLVELWQGKSSDKFVSQNDEIFGCDKNFKAFLILLAPPNDIFLKEYPSHLKDIILFEDIIKEKPIDAQLRQKIIECFNSDMKEVFNILEKPSQGKRLRNAFLKERGAYNG
jgi:hypothetical protein